MTSEQNRQRLFVLILALACLAGPACVALGVWMEEAATIRDPVHHDRPETPDPVTAEARVPRAKPHAREQETTSLAALGVSLKALKEQLRATFKKQPPEATPHADPDQ
jgi:hypothetical protein